MVDLAALPWPCTTSDKQSKHVMVAAKGPAGPRIEVAEGKFKFPPTASGAQHAKLSANFKRAPQNQAAFCAANSVSGRALLAKDSADCDPTPVAKRVEGGVGNSDRQKGAVEALLGGLEGAAKKSGDGLRLVDRACWQRVYNKRTQSLRCGGARSRVHQAFDGAWLPAPADGAPPKEQDWSETLRSGSCTHGELKRLYEATPQALDEQVHSDERTATAASEMVDLYNEVSELYGKRCQPRAAAKANQPPQLKQKAISAVGSKPLQMLETDESTPICLCGPGRRRLEALVQEQNSLRRCVSAQRVALKCAKDALTLPSGPAEGPPASRQRRTQSARGRRA